MNISHSPLHPPSGIRAIAPSAPEEVNISRAISTLWRGKWLIAALTFVTASIAAFYTTQIAVPLYRATAVVILETNQDQIVDLQSVATGLTGDYTEINSELEVLRARGLIGKVVDQLDLTNDSEFNETLRPPSILGQARDWIGAVILPAAYPRRACGPIQTLMSRGIPSYRPCCPD